MVNCFSSAFCSCSWWTVLEDLLSSWTSGTRKVPDVTGPDSLYIICDSPESRGSMNQTVAPWIDEGRCLPTESSYENLVKSAWQSCCSKQGSKPQLTVFSPTISMDYWKSKTKKLMRICYLAQKRQSSQCEAFFDFNLCTHSVCAYVQGSLGSNIPLL
jgi:hypothetical protein